MQLTEPKKVGGWPTDPGISTITDYRFEGTFAFEVQHRTEGAFYALGDVKPAEWEARLPHSCDEWVIGDAAALAEFITEAQAVLAWMEAQR